uniref:Uncharacterized protein n=1 Tax=Aegilops tauschii subsp. strangulata TaxID=200361 RepID=A0A453QYC8_AEGTS
MVIINSDESLKKNNTDESLMRALQADVLPCVPQEVDGGVPVDALPGDALQLPAVDVLRLPQVRLRAPPHHQRRRLRHREPLHRHVPGLRPQERQAPHRQALHWPRRRPLRPHRPRHHAGVVRPPPRPGRRLDLRRRRARRLRRSLEHHQACDPDQERGVHALLAVLLPGPQRGHLVRVRRAQEGHLRGDAQRAGLLVRRGADGALHGVPEQEARHRGTGARGDEAAGARQGGGRRRQAAGRRADRGEDQLRRRGAPH